MSAWSHLPNAAHIDRVITSLKEHPECWVKAWGEVWNMAWDMAWDMASDAARITYYDAAFNAAQDAAYYAARGSILALIMYDDAAKYLNMTVDQLRMWAILSEDPAAVLLLPAVIAFEQISELETT